jgi:hypothetical protein
MLSLWCCRGAYRVVTVQCEAVLVLYNFVTALYDSVTVIYAAVQL